MRGRAATIGSVPEPTIYDIARRAGVGIATVSRVLNGHQRVTEATRAAVQRAMDDLGYRPNRAARRLAAGGPNRPRIAALLPLFSTDFYASVARPIAHELMAADMDLVLYDVANREAKNRLLDRIVDERACEALILCSMGVGPERQQQFAQRHIPYICVDYQLPGVPSVHVDNVAGSALATRHLREAGAKRIALVGGPLTAHAFRDREQGFLSVAGPVAPVLRAATATRDAARAAVRELLHADPAIDGLVCVNDQLAVGALEELAALGRRVPDEVQVMGFDDQPLMDALGLSTIRQPMVMFGSWAAQAIIRRVNQPTADIPSAELALTLVSRRTTRPLGKSSGSRRKTSA
jgi:DNA-binding LacI/PurR family transcriptional regulator